MASSSASRASRSAPVRVGGSSCGGLTSPVRTFTTPRKSGPSPTGRNAAATGPFRLARTSASTVKKSARSRSILFTTTTRGMPKRSAVAQARSVPTSTPPTALTSTSTLSAARMPPRISRTKSAKPGVSSTVTSVPSWVRRSTPVWIENPCAFSASVWSLRVVPSSTRPMREMTPLRCSRASASVVFPVPLCAARLTMR